ncbi:MAG: hypothetical protein KGM99_04190 [Burkholderiales bacterium]|nr:hypothetical protein [Burkholderiales bacterium]
MRQSQFENDKTISQYLQCFIDLEQQLKQNEKLKRLTPRTNAIPGRTNGLAEAIADFAFILNDRMMLACIAKPESGLTHVNMVDYGCCNEQN